MDAPGILTTCAACAAPLAHDAPRCVRCKLRYCNATCQHDHWRRGHKQMCKKIHRGGNAEQYNADKKYKEAVAVAVEACAEDVNGDDVLITISMRRNYAMMLYRDDGATIGDLHEAVETLEDLALIARRVFGSSHPELVTIELGALKEAQRALRAREALLAKYLLYAASALAIAAFALARSRRSR